MAPTRRAEGTGDADGGVQRANSSRASSSTDLRIGAIAVVQLEDVPLVDATKVLWFQRHTETWPQPDDLLPMISAAGRPPDACVDDARPDYLPGRVIFVGSTQASKSAADTRPSAVAASLSVVPSLCAFLAIFAALS